MLCQKSTVLEYQQQFEQLRPLILLQNPGLTEKYFVDSCIAGMNEDIRHSVQMFYPSSVQSVFALARLLEENIASRGKHRGNKFYSSSISSPSRYNSTIPVFGINNVMSKNESLSGSLDVNKQSQYMPQIKNLSPTETQERRSKGLSDNSDEIWSVKHKCKAKQLFLIVGDHEDNTELSDTTSDPEPFDSFSPATPLEVAISLNALSGNTSYQTQLLKGRVHNSSLTMLMEWQHTQLFRHQYIKGPGLCMLGYASSSSLSRRRNPSYL